jgi:hypothetical protein
MQDYVEDFLRNCRSPPQAFLFDFKRCTLHPCLFYSKSYLLTALAVYYLHRVTEHLEKIGATLSKQP